MGEHPDFSNPGYQAIRELGRNREAGRITYLATALNHNQQVVIKEFRFAMTGSDWSGYKAYQREIEVLQQLDHPRIPKYLDSFETLAGFCLVQEYKNAPSLAERNSFTPEEVKQIAKSVLEILVYLQNRVPSVIHRDIKPENILVDEQFNAYLIDFGFARIRGGELAMSSVAAGTPGFMPPEEQFGRSLTEASDLYSLGATLICLLTGTRSVDVGNLMDDNYRFNFKSKTPKINPLFTDWLEKMVAPNLKQRYRNAGAALKALKPMKGTATALEILGRSLQQRKLAITIFGLATITLGGFNLLSNFLPLSLEAAIEEEVRREKRCPGCELIHINLEGADLSGGDLSRADLKDVNVMGADLSDANLSDADLRRADFSRANLSGANLSGAKLGGAMLWQSKLGGADLRNANLRDTNLGLAALNNANLRGAQLEGANLWRADFSRANLSGANLKDANLKDANLKDANLENAIMPDGTKHK
ncbi:serine/threonine-protein kinase [Microcoleus sp. FACHB-672]|uniref:serine/threonine-protein kinase n=1 Tax=Microcoleus sp. FACHB-672 TaxID=2692825 RepID=UPI001683516C|nr:serine/threonine-protein kinase [Microcoleus sp. FACHB-672]MBD2040672.1 pentapeptide repeat-containing protein [Microcoleus sp. FACHB-672]